MGYIENQLSGDEEIIFDTEIHPIVFLAPAVLTIIAIVIGVVGAGALSLLAFSVALVAPLLFIVNLIEYATSEFAVTNRRVMIKTGLIGRKTVETMLTKVEGVQVDQGVFGRMFDFGTISVTGTGGTMESFRHVREPLVLRQYVQDGASSSHAKAAQEHLAAIQQPASHTTSDSIGQLERLAKLREQGVLSAEEFEQQKRKILEA